MIFFVRERNGQEGGEDICLASIDLWEVGSGNLNNTTQRLVFQGEFWATLSLKNTQLGLQHVRKSIQPLFNLFVKYSKLPLLYH